MARVRSEKGIGDFGKHYDCAVAEMEISIKTSAHPISPHLIFRINDYGFK
jgi:hypothetical protein